MKYIKIQNLLKLSILSILALSLVSCGDSDNTEFDMEDNSTELMQITETFGQEGNIYKPVSDESASGGGNLVVLLSAKYTEQFDSCEMINPAGETEQLFCLNTVPWTMIPFSCFSNGNRQTWRANFKCTSAGEVRVVCRDSVREVTFTVPEAQRGQICTRFG